MKDLELLNNLKERKQIIQAGGGEAFINAQHNAGKKTARERMSMLFDIGSFIEIYAFFGNMGVPCEGVVSGYGSIDGRLVYAYAQDYSILNGAIGEIHAKKICRIMDLALQNGAPIISLIDSGGVRIEEGLNSLIGLGKIMAKTAELSGVVPQISAIMGPCSGGLAIAAQSSDFVFATKAATMFINGPQIIYGETGEEADLSAEKIAEITGSIQFVSDDETSLIQSIRSLVFYLPSNNLEDAPSSVVTDDLNRSNEKLTTLAGTSFNVLTTITDIADNNRFIEVSNMFAKNIITGFARINGYSIGIVANQPIENDGLLDNKAANKAARFIRFCNCFSIPLVTLIDTPGFTVSKDQEYGSLARNSAKLSFAYAEATVPKVNLIMNRAYGSAFLAMSSSADFTLAWHTAKISPMLPDGAAVMLYMDEISTSPEPIKARAEKTEQYIKTVASPYNAASYGFINDIIEPDSTRQRIISALDMLASKRQIKPAKAFGNIPM